MEARMEALVTIRLAEVFMQVREEVTEDLQWRALERLVVFHE